MDFAATDCQTQTTDKLRIIINVGGFRHETSVTTLQNIPDTRLAWIAENSAVYEVESKEYFFDRHPTAFSQVINFYRTGKLHCPTGMCGPMFEEELMFWGIDEKQMEPCCWGNYTQHREAEENLRAFVGPGFEDLKSSDYKHSNRSSSLESMDEQHCWRRLQPKIWAILDEPHSSQLAKVVSYMSCLFITFSIAIFCATTMPGIRNKGEIVGTNVGLDHIEMICSIVFSIEFLMRFIFCPSKLLFIRGLMNWIDFIAIVPFFGYMIYQTPIVKMFVVIRIMRLFRFIKLSYGLQIMVQTLKASFHELVLLLLMLLIPVVMFSSIVYYLEVIIQKEKAIFTSVPDSFWWCLITMTTVGYGDMTPQTWPGKVVGGACAICGVLIVALPISVIGSNFNLYYSHAQARLKLPMKQHRLVLGGVPGLLSKQQELSSRRKKRPTNLIDGDTSFEASTGSNSPEIIPRRTRHLLNPDDLPYAEDQKKSALVPLLEPSPQEKRQECPTDGASDLTTQRRRPRRTAGNILPIAQLKEERDGRIILESHSLHDDHLKYDSTPTLCVSGPECVANGTCNPFEEHINGAKNDLLIKPGDFQKDTKDSSDVKPVARIAPKISNPDADDLNGKSQLDGDCTGENELRNGTDKRVSPPSLTSSRKISLSDSKLSIMPQSNGHTDHIGLETHRIRSESDTSKVPMNESVVERLPNGRHYSPSTRSKEFISNGAISKNSKDFLPRSRTSTHRCSQSRTSIGDSDDHEFLETKI